MTNYRKAIAAAIAATLTILANHLGADSVWYIDAAAATAPLLVLLGPANEPTR